MARDRTWSSTTGASKTAERRSLPAHLDGLAVRVAAIQLSGIADRSPDDVRRELGLIGDEIRAHIKCIATLPPEERRRLGEAAEYLAHAYDYLRPPVTEASLGVCVHTLGRSASLARAAVPADAAYMDRWAEVLRSLPSAFGHH